MMKIDVITYLKQAVNIDLDEPTQRKFEAYKALLLAENAKYNLTAITDPDEIDIKHFADSLLGTVAIGADSSLCDVGSGAGFPAIPLALVRQDLHITLVDSLNKRIEFTKMACDLLGIAAEFCHARAEDYAQKRRECFDVVTARAVAPLNVLLEYTAALVRIGGVVVAYKTDSAEAADAQRAAQILGLRLGKSHNFVLPDGSRRCILVYDKVAPTPDRYPRGQNKPRKQPLI